ncbi:MAG: hypothetical protein EGS41_06125 [Prevotella sp.]|nr:hypothetical protein [Prevotella sp.]
MADKNFIFHFFQVFLGHSLPTPLHIYSGGDVRDKSYVKEGKTSSKRCHIRQCVHKYINFAKNHCVDSFDTSMNSNDMANVQIISEKLALLRDFFSKIYHFGAFHPILETLY